MDHKEAVGCCREEVGSVECGFEGLVRLRGRLSSGLKGGETRLSGWLR